ALLKRAESRFRIDHAGKIFLWKDTRNCLNSCSVTLPITRYYAQHLLVSLWWKSYARLYDSKIASDQKIAHFSDIRTYRKSGALERYRQLVVGRSMRSTVYTGKTSSCHFSSRPSLPRTEKIVGRPAKAFTSGALFGGGGGSRMGTQPSVFTVNSPLSAVRFTTGKSVQFEM